MAGRPRKRKGTGASVGGMGVWRQAGSERRRGTDGSDLLYRHFGGRRSWPAVVSQLYVGEERV